MPPSTRKPFIPHPPATPEVRLKKLNQALVDQINEGYLENAVNSCKKILTLNPTSLPTSQTLLFLLLQQDLYAPALTLVESLTASAPSGGGLEFERAYCLYRLHREKEAAEVLAGLGGGERVKALEAQIFYRAGDMVKAKEVYEELLATTPKSSPDYPDLQHNLISTTTTLSFLTTDYLSYLPSTSSASAQELEDVIPSLPTVAGAGPKAAAGRVQAIGVSGSGKGKGKEEKGRKVRHRLPKGAVVGQKFEEDPDRWLPLKQRASYLASVASGQIGKGRKKKGGKEGMGTGMMQGSTNSEVKTSGGGGGKKGKKGK